MNYKINYDKVSKNYSIHRNASFTVIDHILKELENKKLKKVLEIGCGTANYLYLFSQKTKAACFGFDNSEGMINEENKKNPGLNLEINDLHNDFNYESNTFDLVYSIDVIHYVKDLNHYFKECFRIMNNNGIIITITDSEDDLKNRTMTRYFPESLEIEKKRYPSIEKIIQNMKNNNFNEIKLSHTEKELQLDDKIFQKFKNKAYSAIRLISNDSFNKGIKKIEDDMNKKNCIIKVLYTYVWGMKK